MMKKTESPKTKKKRMIPRFLKGAAKFFVFTVLCSLAVTMLDALIPQIVRYTVDSLIGNSEPSGFISAVAARMGSAEYLRHNLWLVAAAVAVTALFSALFKYMTRVMNARGSESMVENMRNTLFSHIERLPYSWHIKNQTGDIIQRCTSDVETVRVFVADQLVELFRIVLLVAFALFMMFSMNIWISLIALIFIPVVAFASIWFYRKIGGKFTEVDESEGVLSAVAQENLTGVRVVRAFGMEKNERDKFEKQNGYFTGLWVQLCNTLSWYWGLGDFMSCFQILTVIVVGTVFAVRGSITTGEFIAFVSYNSMLVWPVRRLGRIVSEMSKAKVSIGRLRHILDSEEEKDRAGASEPDMNGDIVFENVSFSYNDEKSVLNGVSFTVKAGTTFGILGGTGSGKSTLMHLLNRLYDLPPENGRITIGGVDISDMKAQWVRQNIGMVLQEPFLFSRTIEENIGITGSRITADKIKNAAVTACIDKDISGFADGYSTVVGERGVTLSGGQKQRVAIARTLTLDAPIIVFDDSLSAVDTETDSHIREALKNRIARKTVILISHRIVSLMEADMILVLDNGEVSQLGTHSELMESDGIYRRIFERQSLDTEDENNG